MSADSKKELYIVGLGPGARQKMTQEAIDVVEACEVIAEMCIRDRYKPV